MTLAEIDLVYLGRQALFLTLEAMLPVLLLAAWSPRRRVLLPMAFVVLAGATGMAASMCALVSLRVWSDGTVPMRPFRVGPSYLRLWDLLPFFLLMTWLPSGALLAAGWCWRKVRPLAFSIAPVALLAAWTTFWELGGLTVSSHEDTVWAKSFSRSAWSQVHKGMTREQVVRLIGQPLPREIRPGFMPGSDFWVRNWAAGYFACLTFDDGKVREKLLWYSD